MKKQLIMGLLALLGLSLAAPLAMAAPEKTTVHHTRAAKSSEVVGVININTADAKQLATLKRIGAKKADAIVAYRQANGDFKSIDDLNKVKGISKSILDANRDHLTV